MPSSIFSINSRKPSCLSLAVLALAAFAAFWPALGHDFLVNWDDTQYVVRNLIVHGLTVENIKTAFTTSLLWNYAPIHLISYMLDYEIWGLRASGFIFMNILLHALNGILFYLLLRRMAGEKAWAFFASILFLLHPVQVESVVWISQRKTALAMFFFLIALHFYVTYREKDEILDIRLYLLSILAFTLSLLSKSVAVVFPVALLVFDLCYRKGRDFKTLIIDKIPFIVIAIIFGLIAIHTQSAENQGGRTSYHGGSLYATVLTMLPVLIRYLIMVIWPAHLSAYYDPSIKTHVDFEVLAATTLIILLCISGVVLYFRKRDLFFWFALFFIGLLPVSQIVPIVTLMNDRYLYFPMLGAMAFLSFALLRDVTWDQLLQSRRRLPISILCLAVLGTCAVATFDRIPVWQNSYTLWSDAVKKAPHVALTHEGFGEGLLEVGRIDEAIEEFKIALRLRPSILSKDLDSSTQHALATTYNDLGTAYGMKGMTNEAIEHFTIAIRMNPKNDKAHFNLGNALVHKGLLNEAIRSFETAVSLNPGNPQFHANLRHIREIVRSGDVQVPPSRRNP